MYKGSTEVHKVDRNRYSEVNTIFFISGYTGNLSCTFKGTFFDLKYDWYKQCPGDEGPSVFGHIESQEQSKDNEFDASFGHDLFTYNDTFHFIMTPDLDGCIIICKLYYGKEETGKNVNNSVRIEQDYTLYTTYHSVEPSYTFMYITFINLYLSIMFLISAGILYKRKIKKFTEAANNEK